MHFFEENGKIVLLDYKTDYVEQQDGSDLVGKYGIQLKYYQKHWSGCWKTSGRKYIIP